MHAEAKSMDISSFGGDVAIALPPGCRFELDASAGVGVALDPLVSVEGKTGFCSVVGVASVISALGDGPKAPVAEGSAAPGAERERFPLVSIRLLCRPLCVSGLGSFSVSPTSPCRLYCRLVAYNVS